MSYPAYPYSWLEDAPRFGAILWRPEVFPKARASAPTGHVGVAVVWPALPAAGSPRRQELAAKAPAQELK